MKINFKLISSFFFSLFVVFLTATITHAAVTLPSTVRIGLYYKGAPPEGHSQTSCFDISAPKGLDLGYYASSKFGVLYKYKYSNKVTIRKDGFFVLNDSTFTEYSPSGKIPSGTKMGPYHVQIGDKYTSYTNARAQVPVLKEKGIAAYPVYNDGWRVWTGNYLNQNDTLYNMNSVIAPKVPSLLCTIVNSDPTRIVIALSGNTLFMYDKSSGAFQIHPNTANSPLMFKLNNQHFRGNLEVKRLTNSDMTLVNVIKPQLYLYGVVPSEMLSNSKLEALKAQAICAGTYTYNCLKKHSSLGFDLCSTVDCQMYLGYDNEEASTNRAVDETIGKIITYKGSAAEINYYNSSGGKTEDVRNVWGNSCPYLISVDDPYEAPGTEWVQERTPAYIKGRLSDWGYNIGDVTAVTATKKAPSGRVTEVVVKGTKGSKTFTIERCRTFFGLKSQWYTISSPDKTYFRANGGKVENRDFKGMTVVTSKGTQILTGVNNVVTLINGANTKKSVSLTPGAYIFTGRGWGHGVGMSQEGAMGFARHGYTCTQILKHYFPGTEIQ
ncbi:MAG: SpoIID/LytB domain-containing protein [Clostridia bacterium]|jgi:stage II sporulation protein D